MNLYEINEKIRVLLDQGFCEECVDTETGEILEDKAHELLDGFQEERTNKIENIALYIKNLVSDAEAIKEEEKKLLERRRTKEKKIEWLKQYLSSFLLFSGTENFESSRVVIRFRKSEKVIIENENELDARYVIIETQRTPDKKAIKEAIKIGRNVKGAYIQENKNIQIK